MRNFMHNLEGWDSTGNKNNGTAKTYNGTGFTICITKSDNGSWQIGMYNNMTQTIAFGVEHALDEAVNEQFLPKLSTYLQQQVKRIDKDWEKKKKG